MTKTIAVLGGQGAIGGAVLREAAARYPDATIHGFAREWHSPPGLPIRTHKLDYHDEQAIQHAAETAAEDGPLDLVFVATGMLHDGALMPEKSLRDLSADAFQHLLAANTILPALAAKHFLPKLHKDKRSVFAALSARVGSISDNQLGGWYAYRASKAALNMVIKTAAIETARRHKQAIVVGLHPGTVASPLSGPFQKNVASGKLFSPDYAAQRLLTVLDHLTPDQSGQCFAWDGEEINP